MTAIILTQEILDKLRPCIEESMDKALAQASRDEHQRLVFECRLDELTALDRMKVGDELPPDLVDAAEYFGVIPEDEEWIARACRPIDKPGHPVVGC